VATGIDSFNLLPLRMTIMDRPPTSHNWTFVVGIRRQVVYYMEP